MSKKTITVTATILLLVIVGSVWAFRSRTDPQIEKIKQLGAEAFKEDQSPEQRRQSFELIHQEMQKLTPEQREVVHQQGRQEFERRMDEQMDAYFALPPEERVAYLDKQIEEGEKRRKEWESRRQAARGNAPQVAGGPMPNAGQRPPRSNNPGDRATRRNMHLDDLTPEQRAKRSAFFADMQKRRYELGLPPNPFHGPRR